MSEEVLPNNQKPIKVELDPQEVNKLWSPHQNYQSSAVIRKRRLSSDSSDKSVKTMHNYSQRMKVGNAILTTDADTKSPPPPYPSCNIHPDFAKINFSGLVQNHLSENGSPPYASSTVSIHNIRYFSKSNMAKTYFVSFTFSITSLRIIFLHGKLINNNKSLR